MEGGDGELGWVGAGGMQASLLALGQGGVLRVEVGGGNSLAPQPTTCPGEGSRRRLGLGLGPDTVNGPMRERSVIKVQHIKKKERIPSVSDEIYR